MAVKAETAAKVETVVKADTDTSHEHNAVAMPKPGSSAALPG